MHVYQVNLLACRILKLLKIFSVYQVNRTFNYFLTYIHQRECYGEIEKFFCRQNETVNSNSGEQSCPRSQAYFRAKKAFVYLQFAVDFITEYPLRTWVIVRQTNMADFLEDVGVGYYRSLDPPKNFVVKYENILLPITQFKIISI